MPRVFVSYRREDSAGHVGRLHENLERVFGAKKIFLDVDSITPGADFKQTIREAISKSDVVLAVIGRHWLAITDEQGQRRLDNSNDYVRFELATALASKTRVVPVLVRGANIPSAQELPPDLSELTKYHGVKLRDERWSADIDDLVKRILVKRISGRSIVPWMHRHKILTTIIRFFIILIIIIFGMFSFLPRQPTQTVEQFLTLLTQGETHGAYALTASLFQANTDQKKFQEMVERLSLNDNASHSWPSWKVELGGRAILDGEVITKQGIIIPMTVTLVKEHGDWRILSIQPHGASSDLFEDFWRQDGN